MLLKIVTAYVCDKHDKKMSQKILPKRVACVFTCKKPLIINELQQFYMAAGDEIFAFSLSTGEILHNLNCHNAQVIGIRRNPFNYKSIISCDKDGIIISWAHEGNIRNNQKFNLHSKCNLSFFDVLENGSFVIVDAVGKLEIISSWEDEGYLLMDEVNKSCNGIALSGNLICGLKTNHAFVAQLSKDGNWQTTLHRLKYNPTCIACHPHENIIAIGGPKGVISIYNNIFSSNPIITNYHWHFLPVADICFNRAGNELYSGGGESVVMKWKLSSNTKKPMPRLGMPIQFLTVGDDEAVITHSDNDITIYHGETETPIKGDSYIIPIEKSDTDIFLHHSSTKSLITHGSIGYLQFYSLEENRRRFQMDITIENFVAPSREQKSYHQIIQAAAVSEDGVWIVTNSSCKIANKFDNYNLKFWTYMKSKNKWVMNTYIEMPHFKKIISLTLSKKSYNCYFCVSCSDDHTAKVWKTYQTGNRKFHQTWAINTVKEFKKLKPTASAFHPDMSLFAISFANYVAIYQTTDMSFVHSFYNEENRDDILNVHFASEHHGPYIITRTCSSLNVINLVTYEKCNLLMNNSCMAINPATGIVALFKKSESIVYLLRIRANDDVTFEVVIENEYNEPSCKSVKSAHWIPISSKHILHFKTTFQEIYKLDIITGEKSNNVVIATEVPAFTPFSRLLATTKTSLSENQKANTEYVPSIKNWLSERIYEIDSVKMDSFNDLILNLRNKILPDI